MRCGVFSAAVFVSMSPVRAAEKVEVDADSGMNVIYTFASTYQGTCDSADPPTYSIKKDAAHGRIVTDIVKTTFPADNKRCAGKPVQVFVVGYQPERGYRGKDEAVVSMRFTPYTNESIIRSRSLHFKITVK